jgi:hypothetical protein
MEAQTAEGTNNGNGNGHSALVSQRPLDAEEGLVDVPEPERERPKNSAMAEALRTEIMRLCDTGDPQKGGLFTHRVALQIGRVVQAGRELLMAERLSMMDAEDLLKRKLRKRSAMKMGNSYNSSVMVVGSYDDEDMGDSDGSIDSDPIAQSSAVENFGMQAVKQVVAAAQAASNSPEKLVEAIAKARKLGLGGLAEKLEARLLSDGSGELPIVPAIPASAPSTPVALSAMVVSPDAPVMASAVPPPAIGSGG